MNENVTKRYQIWKLADFVRDKLKITTPITIEKLQYIVESSGGQLIAVNSPKEIDKDFDAVLKLSPEGEYPYFTITYAAWKDDARIIFSIAHELGHFFLHDLEKVTSRIEK